MYIIPDTKSFIFRVPVYFAGADLSLNVWVNHALISHCGTRLLLVNVIDYEKLYKHFGQNPEHKLNFVCEDNGKLFTKYINASFLIYDKDHFRPECLKRENIILDNKTEYNYQTLILFDL